MRSYIAEWLPIRRAGMPVSSRCKEGRMATESHEQDQNLRQSQTADQLTGVAPPESQLPSGEDKSTYQVSEDHLVG